MSDEAAGQDGTADVEVVPRKRLVLDLDWLPEPLPTGPHVVTFLPARHGVEVEHGETVFDAGKKGMQTIPSTCGGKGTCGRCRVRVEGGGRPPGPIERQHLSRAELAAGVRLACRQRVEADMAVTVLSERR